MTNTKWLRRAEVKRLAGGISDATEFRWRANGRLPAPVYFGPKSPRWDEAEILAAIERIRADASAMASRASELTAAARQTAQQHAAVRRAEKLLLSDDEGGPLRLATHAGGSQRAPGKSERGAS